MRLYRSSPVPTCTVGRCSANSGCTYIDMGLGHQLGARLRAKEIGTIGRLFCGSAGDSASWRRLHGTRVSTSASVHPRRNAHPCRSTRVARRIGRARRRDESLLTESRRARRACSIESRRVLLRTVSGSAGGTTIDGIPASESVPLTAS